MKKILAFGASNSKHSINKKLAHYTAKQLNNADVNYIDLNDWVMPLFGIDREKNEGIPENAKAFKQLVKDCDGIIISFAEHNGSFSTAFKNIYDWISRLEGKIWENKPCFFLSTSPGARGGKSVMEHALETLPRRGCDVAAHFSLPTFNENFNEHKGIINEDFISDYNAALGAFQSALEKSSKSLTQ